MKRGAFIVIEGLDRSGKSTQASRLVERLKAARLECLHHRNDCLPPNEKPMPAAFITFKQCRSQVPIFAFMLHLTFKITVL